MKKRLYWNSCSFLDTEAILHNTALNKLFTNVENEPIDRNSYKASVGGSSNESIFRRTYIDKSVEVVTKAYLEEHILTF